MAAIPSRDNPNPPVGGGVALSQRGALAILILVELLTFSYMSETFVLPALVGLAAIVGWQRRWRYRISPDRQVIAALLVGVLFVVGWRVNPHHLAHDTMIYLSPFLHSLGLYLLVLQTAALFLRHERDIMPITLPWPGVFVMVSAGDVNATDNQRATFQVLAMLFMAATALYFSATARATAGNTRAWGGFGKRVFLACVLAAMAGIAWIGSNALHRYERELNRIVSEMLTPTIAAGRAGFPNHSELGSISRRKSARANDIALRIVSSSRPGYWRGKTYHWLDGTRGMHAAAVTRWEELPPRQWRPLAESSRNRLLEPTGHSGRFHRYVLAPSNGTAARRFEVWLAPPQWGAYFLPAGTREILSDEPFIVTDFRHTTSPRDGAVAHYAVRAGAPRITEATVRPTNGGPFSNQALTAVPEDPGLAGDDDQIRDLAQRIFADCQSVAEQVAAVENYFRTHYQYRLGVTVPPNRDPVHWFLETRPQAHCEFFAQGAALLLRMGDIPTRYVTGFVVGERNDYGDYWIARNEDAHAWCEAWDPERGWVLVEATPPSGVPAAEDAAWHRQGWEYLSGALQQFRYRFSQGGWHWLARELWRFLLSPAGWLVLLAICGYLVLRSTMLWRARNPNRLPPRIRELHRLLRRMDRRMARYGIRRTRGETLTRFARRLATENHDIQAAQWYRAYATARYGGNEDDATITQLRSRLDQWRSPRRPASSPNTSGA